MFQCPWGNYRTNRRLAKRSHFDETYMFKRLPFTLLQPHATGGWGPEPGAREAHSKGTAANLSQRCGKGGYSTGGLIGCNSYISILHEAVYRSSCFQSPISIMSIYHIPKASEEEIQAALGGQKGAPLPPRGQDLSQDLSQEPTDDQKPDPLVKFFQGGGGSQPEVTKVTRFQSSTKRKRSRSSTQCCTPALIPSVGFKFQHCT